ncbi:MAG TPA: hypothetical protein VE685_19645 [Thermoanaerobaculia bacterium]|nr:hypothetical protein [Thermoanaerobaculia bacterium]
MSDVLRDARKLKNQARRRREAQRYEEAADLLKEATDLLEPTLIDLKSDDPSLFETDVARELSDCYGSLGGVLRSAGHFEDSVKAYESGYGLEKDKRYGMINSYNLVQRLVARMLLKPELIGSAEWVVKDIEDVEDLDMWKALDDAASVIQEQRSVRATDPWFLADRALVFLLLGRPEEEEAWQEFRQAPSFAYAITSTLRVINDLLASMGEVKNSGSVGPRSEEVYRRLARAQALLENLQSLQQA